MFWQLEGLAIDEDITLADLQGVLLQFARQMFGEDTRVRLRPGYFPFTEPSVEVDVSCFRCGGTGWEGAGRCGTCKGEAWIEILGSGMVDPNVLDYVAGTGYDKERVQGFAFGMGIERIARASPRSPTCACSTRTTCACSSSSEPAHEGPGRLAAQYAATPACRQEIADALTMAGDKVERLHRTGVGDTAAFLTGRVLGSERHPNADRLSVCVVDVGREN